MAPLLENALVRIQNHKGEVIGTGFVVSENLVLTCAHVVETSKGKPPSEPVQIVFHSNGEEQQAQVLSEYWPGNADHDVAVLRLLEGDTPKEIQAAQLGKTSGIEGHPCVTFGYPSLGEVQGVEGRGHIYRLVSENTGRRLIQLTSEEITKGFSGAPLLDQVTGRIVGMVTWITDPKYFNNPDYFGRLGNAAFAIPSEFLHQFLSPLIPNLRLHLPEAVDDYLDAVRDYCASLPYLTLHDIRPPRPLDEVYIPLKARPQQTKEEKQDKEQRLIQESQSSGPLDIAKILSDRKHQHLLILGEPGAGKSTLMRQLAEKAWDAPKEIGLDRPHLPLLVPLSRLGAIDGTLEERFSHALSGELALVHYLPQGFFTDWPEQTEAPWLILLDALDEVPSQQRARLMGWLKRALKGLEGHRVVITSRPTGYTTGELDETIFGHYDLLPFTTEQSEKFARKWFPVQAETFLNELQSVRSGALSGTPLLLTIAVKVFYHHGALPERRSALYEQFVEHWLREAQQHGLDGELGEKLVGPAELQMVRLAHVALWMTENQEHALFEDLVGTLSQYLQSHEDLTPVIAKTFGAKFIDVMSRRSGVFIRQGDFYQFLHPSIREFLAAWGVVETADNELELVWEKIIKNSEQENYWQVSLFALSILSNKGKDVSLVINRIRHFESFSDGSFNHQSAWYFLAEALLEKIEVSEKVETQLLKDLAAEMRFWYLDDSSQLVQLIEVFVALGRTAPLFYIAQLERDFLKRSRKIAIDGLKKLKSTDNLLNLAKDEKIDLEIRSHAAVALGGIGQIDEAIAILLKIARGDDEDWQKKDIVENIFNNFELTLDAVKALGELGHTEEALPILSAILQSEDVHEVQKGKAFEVIGLIVSKEQIIPMIETALFSINTHKVVKLTAVEVLGMIGREEAIPIISAVLHGKSVNENIRDDVITGIRKLGRFEDMFSVFDDMRLSSETRKFIIKALEDLQCVAELRKIINNSEVDESSRIEAANELGKLGFPDVLLACAENKQYSVWFREEAVEKLIRLGKSELAIQACLALANDAIVSPWIRERMAKRLGELGKVDEAALVLIDLLRTEHINSWVRKRALELLNEFGKADLLSQLRL